MKKTYLKLLSGVTLAVSLLLTSCHSAYEVTKAEGEIVPINAVWDAKPDAEAMALLAPYKAKVDSVMYHVVGTAEISMDRSRPESLLSNLIADVLRESATVVLGKPADMGMVNIGGIRSSLTEGIITTENIYEILPFENSLCVLTMKGSVLKQLFENIAARGGEGVSGIRLRISKDGKLLQGSIGGKPVEEDKTYTVATVDYLADGNDGMIAFPQADKRECPEGATLRGLFMKYVENRAEAGKKVTSRIEGRIEVEN
ncbi:5'-nucleotidase C-terminal domain-containing protein [Bacteroides helcogenes]|uniref:5'-Nucleotidase domain-containing protein n=1 Tax=Bacteroides helcogenes (strain ATCC 35417 / DSM 20613 / JCM 6297 / CCUG 15421 / P 36-108) TaxID=693979 RepID=E6STS4_BACT6|nr:5'-nucleotidase [Bacteroides helcogenes]ADV42277.1 5'-Nucleotidase domain-containing protein [Bacteroides helcogenes P 36-108]MDY5237269.1 5'-nucleotidase [Bacteroides helcogenes]